MLRYTTLDGRVLDLSALNDGERRFLMRAYAAYRDGADWGAVSRLVEGMENPLLQSTNGCITLAVSDHPLYQAVRDLEDRAGIARGDLLAEPGDYIERDPLVDAEIHAPKL